MAVISRWKWAVSAGVGSTLLTAATATLFCILGVTFATNKQSIAALAIVTACLHAISTIVLAYLIWRKSRKAAHSRGRPIRSLPRVRVNADIFLSFGLSVLASGISIATLVWMKVLEPSPTEIFVGQKTSAIFVCTLILWVLSAISQSLFYTILFLCPAKSSIANPSEQIPMAGDLLDTAVNSRPGTARTLNGTPTASARVSPKRSSIRSSLTIAIRPTSSKTKLVSHAPSYPPSVTTTRASTDSAFDSWDTSSISPQMRETVLRSSPALARNPLSPIPGSRSPSPAKALEGPFLPSPPPSRPTTSRSQPSSPPPAFNNSYFTQQLLMTSHSQPTSPINDSPSTFFSFASFSRPSIVRGRSSMDSLPSTVRARSASENAHPGVQNEDHIHPLFRSSSPTPPPSATPGTVVTAAPGSFSGLLIHERMVRRMRSGSLPASPSPLAVGTGYFFPEDGIVRRESGDLDGEGITGEEAEDEAMRRKIEQGEERKMTPPIPDFILSVARSDSNAYGKRKSESGESTERIRDNS
ncbi:hypothetical protein MMC13_001456 [Lambiella insularis]|nr:hypothetical protein [Lambiella insularis]